MKLSSILVQIITVICSYAINLQRIIKYRPRPIIIYVL